MEPIQSQIASSVKESQSEPEAKMTPSEFKQYNRLAERMDVFHNMFRESWNTMYNACKNNKLPSSMSNRKFLSLGLGFCEHIEGHHSIEENYLYPILAKKMPAFRKEVELLTQHKNIHKGLEKLQVYLQDCDRGQKSLEFSELKEIMESFGEVLWQHLDDEVKELGANEMRKYWTLDELKKLPRIIFMISADREKVELYISCRKLKNLDVFSKSDPQVRCYLKDHGQWKLFDKSETIQDNLNPNFTKTFVVDFIFEIQQHIMFEVVDVDSSTSFEPLGSVETTIGAIMGAKKQTSILDLHLKGSKTAGKIIIRGEKSGDARNLIYWQFSAQKLMNTDGFFGKSDPFLRFFKLRPGGDQLQVHETEVVMDNLNPIWKAFDIVDTKLCTDHNNNFRIECWDWEKSGKFQYIGDCEVSLAQIRSGKTELQLRNPKKKSTTGTLRISNFSIQEKPSFIDYLRGGTQLNAVVAIDFTGSNGNPRSPGSLHAMLPNGQLNEYQKAINSVCQIVLNYDFDQQVPVYGFGGKPHYPSMNSMVVSHCFPCSGNMQQQEVLGLQGIMDVYTYGLQNVELSGPTYFAPLIREASAVCQVNKQSENEIYSILLIITDGEIHDMDDTIDAICTAAYLPLSIIIVGVGNADFSKMEILDGDQGLCNSKGQRCTRDLVQFVPFREFNGDMYLLAQHLLAEVPEQLVQYMKTIGKKPRPPQMVDIHQMGYSVAPGTGQQQPQPQGQVPVQVQPNIDYGAGQPGLSPNLMEQVNMGTSQNVNIQAFGGNQPQNQNYQGGYGNPY